MAQDSFEVATRKPLNRCGGCSARPGVTRPASLDRRLLRTRRLHSIRSGAEVAEAVVARLRSLGNDAGSTRSRRPLGRGVRSTESVHQQRQMDRLPGHDGLGAGRCSSALPMFECASAWFRWPMADSWAGDGSSVGRTGSRRFDHRTSTSQIPSITSHQSWLRRLMEEETRP